MNNNFEGFNNFFSGVQSIGVAISLIFGGLWAYSTFVYKNPSFYEEGIAVLGFDPEVISGEISTVTLNERTSDYEVILTLKNHSLTHGQSVNYKILELAYMLIANHAPEKVTSNEESSLKRSGKKGLTGGNGSGMLIPAGQERSFSWHLRLNEPGIYLIEFNPCLKFNKDCLIQKHISVGQG